LLDFYGYRRFPFKIESGIPIIMQSREAKPATPVDARILIKPYNNEYAIYQSGLQNTGVICYFNSMLQSLISCTSLNELFLNNPAIRTRNKLCSTLYNIIATAHEHPNAIAAESPKLWNLFIQATSRRHRFGLGQEDANEGFTLFIDALQCREVEALFEHRYCNIIQCGACKHEHRSTPDEGIFVELSAEDLERSENDLARAVKLQMADLTDYKCDKCGSRDSKTQKKQMTMLSEVIIVLFKKYSRKWAFEVPAVMDIPVRDSKIRYRLVAASEHAGSQAGGHYWANVVRRDDAMWIANDISCVECQTMGSSATYMAFYHFVDMIK
jgi:ubiquitin C-terminal hydrolase